MEKRKKPKELGKILVDRKVITNESRITRRKRRRKKGLSRMARIERITRTKTGDPVVKERF